MTGTRQVRVYQDRPTAEGGIIDLQTISGQVDGGWACSVTTAHPNGVLDYCIIASSQNTLARKAPCPIAHICSVLFGECRCQTRMCVSRHLRLIFTLCHQLN